MCKHSHLYNKINVIQSFLNMQTRSEQKWRETSLDRMSVQLHINPCPLKQRRQDVSSPSSDLWRASKLSPVWSSSRAAWLAGDPGSASKGTHTAIRYLNTQSFKSNLLLRERENMMGMFVTATVFQLPGMLTEAIEHGLGRTSCSGFAQQSRPVKRTTPPCFVCKSRV